MIKPNIPNMPNIPGMGAMTDTLDFVKNLWGSMGLPGMNVPGMQGMNVPGMVMPTLSVDEINKRISELKAVESWLSLNMGMLRGTIQALEVQAATISTLQTMGERFSATMNPASAQESSPTAGAAPNGARSSNGADGGISAEREHDPAPEPTKKDEQDAASLTAPLVNAAAWWNMLQDQFKQAVNTAMTETQAVAAAATAPITEKPKAKASAKPKAASSTASSSSTTTRKRKTTK
ncbi:PhaM family polyhydroxyalkanoate granule multifunctional regulatory protein [Noviherbaspirillum sp. ST9]|uniref:PhaM family polyhydroxyalkanoate granule multifunctional regulatory protein n=1 Tax=Noviherbaspirillum sp. ST9 TaxID=3401606 RepID=UPI003B585A89